MAKKPVDIAAVLGAQLGKVSDLDTTREQIEYIDIDQIDDDPNNFYVVEQLDALASNIQLCGLQQPLRVRAGEGERVTIVSGHRRRAALRLLVDDGLGQFRAVPCIRERGEDSEALRKLRLIYANANTRVLSSAEQSRQVAEVEMLLYQLKEEGVEFPGRMRDHVAEACKLSKTKLARLKVIREKLAPDWAKLYQSGKLVEATAYALAKLSPEDQSKIKDLYGKDKRNIEYFREYDVSRWGNLLKGLAGIQCKHGAARCLNAEAMWERCTASSYYGMGCDRCCEKCSNMTNCKYVCSKFKEKVLAEKRKVRDANKSEKEQQKAQEAEQLAAIQRLWSRLGEVRRSKCISIQEVYSLLHSGEWSEWVADGWKKKEEGAFNLTHYSDTPYSERGVTAQGIAALAKRLGVGIAYLFCATDEDADENACDEAEGPTPATNWQTGTDYPRKSMLVALLDIGKSEPIARLLYTDYAGNLSFGGTSTTTLDMTPLAWCFVAPIPDEFKHLRDEEGSV